MENMKSQRRMFSLANVQTVLTTEDMGQWEQLKANPLVKYLGRDASTQEEMFQPELWSTRNVNTF